MGLFSTRKPRSFHHNYIYYDPRKERLREMEDNAKRELGILPPKEFKPEDIRGKFVDATAHLKKRKMRKTKPLHSGILVMIILVLIVIMRYLYTGKLL